MSGELVLNVNEYAHSSDFHVNSSQTKQNINNWSYPDNRSRGDYDQWSAVPNLEDTLQQQTPVIKINATTNNNSNSNRNKQNISDWSEPENRPQSNSHQRSAVPDLENTLPQRTPVIKINVTTNNKSNSNRNKQNISDWSDPENRSQSNFDQWSTVSNLENTLQEQTSVVKMNTITNNNAYSNNAKPKICDWSYSDSRSRSDFDQWSTVPNLKKTLKPQTPVEEINTTTNNNSNSNQYYRSTSTYTFQSELTIGSISEENEKQRRPWFIWIMSIIQLCVFIFEIIYNSLLTTRPIETNLSLNPLFGPNPYVLINIGASFSPCMHAIDGITNNVSSTSFPCPNSATLTYTGCTLSDLCGYNGVSSTPNQWYRFIIPIFLHVGIVHIIFNLLGQLMIAGEIEKKIGILRIAFVYFASGIFGFIFGGNFAPNGLGRVGCSGSLFSMIALSFLDLLYHWKKTKRPKMQLTIHLIDIIVNFVLGLLPGIDNFSHVGGFVMGLLLGLGILGSPVNFRRHKRPKLSRRNTNEWKNRPWYQKLFYNRQKKWWAWWLVRFIALAAAITIFVLFTESFYSGRIKCDGCKYLSCLPVNGWCDLGNIQATNG
ncbi:unnamed protein product [Rotaria sp. Silwood2]|nr:unnamed protein product [Rotaria sp. Silwood2]